MFSSSLPVAAQKFGKVSCTRPKPCLVRELNPEHPSSYT